MSATGKHFFAIFGLTISEPSGRAARTRTRPTHFIVYARYTSARMNGITW